MERVAGPHRRGVRHLAHGNLAMGPVPPVLDGPLTARANGARDAEAAQEARDLLPAGARDERRREILRHDGDVDEAQQGGQPVLPRSAVQDAQVRRAGLELGERIVTADLRHAQSQRRLRQRRVVPVDQDDADAPRQLGGDARGIGLQPRVRRGDHAPGRVLDDRRDGRLPTRGGRGLGRPALARLRKVRGGGRCRVVAGRRGVGR